MKRIQDFYKDSPEVHFVSYTVDPEYDTPEVLKAYAESYQADPKRWYFLSGDKEQIYHLAYHGYKVSALDESEKVTPDFLHSTMFMLVDKEGRIRGYYEATNPEDVDKLILEIKILQSQYE